MKYCTILILLISTNFGHNLLGQTKLDSTIRYSYIHFRLGNATFREVNINFNPFLRYQKKFFLGIGYRQNRIFTFSCFTERGFITSKLHGPVLYLGYDGTNKKHPQVMNLSFQIAYKHLKSDTLTYNEPYCFLGEGSGYADYKIFWHSANVFGAKLYFDGNFPSKAVGLYFGIGGDFQFVTKHFIESGSILYHWPDNDVEKVLYFMPRIDLGFRLNVTKQY